MSVPVLEISGLSVNYRSGRGRVQALRHVGLVVSRHRIVGIVGESGCGKSTLIAAILGLLAPNAEVASGRIEFEGEALLAASPARMRAIRGPCIAWPRCEAPGRVLRGRTPTRAFSRVFEGHSK